MLPWRSYNDAKIQLLDLPGIIEGAAEGRGACSCWLGGGCCTPRLQPAGVKRVTACCKIPADRPDACCLSSSSLRAPLLPGRGRQVIAVCKSADLLLMVLDAGKPHYHREILTRELEAVRERARVWRGRLCWMGVLPSTHAGACWLCLIHRRLQETKMPSCAAAPAAATQVGMRLNRRPPNITFRKKKTGGIAINSMLQLTNLDEKMIQRILQVPGGRRAAGGRAGGRLRQAGGPAARGCAAYSSSTGSRSSGGTAGRAAPLMHCAP